MSAFDAAAGATGGGRRGRVAAATGGGAFGAAAAASSGAGGGGVAGYQSSAFDTTCETVSANIKQLAAVSTALRKQVDALGTKADTADGRTRLTANVTRGRELVVAVNGLVHGDLVREAERSDLASGEKTARKTRHASLQAAFLEAGRQFQRVATEAADKEKRHPLPTGGAGGAAAADDARRGGKGGRGGAGAAGDDDGGAMMASLQQIDLSASLIEERDAAADEIVTSVVQVNEIFRDLAVLVDQQGKDIEVIEANTTAAEGATAKGVDELRQASKYQKSYRNWILIVAAVLILVAGGITAYFLIMNKKSS